MYILYYPIFGQNLAYFSLLIVKHIDVDLFHKNLNWFLTNFDKINLFQFSNCQIHCIGRTLHKKKSTFILNAWLINNCQAIDQPVLVLLYCMINMFCVACHCQYSKISPKYHPPPPPPPPAVYPEKVFQYIITGSRGVCRTPFLFQVFTEAYQCILRSLIFEEQCIQLYGEYSRGRVFGQPAGLCGLIMDED